MKDKEPKSEPTIIDILNESMRNGSNDPENAPTVGEIAYRMGIDMFTLADWMQNDRQLKEGLFAVKEAFDNDPLKDTLDDEIKLDAATLSFGITVVLEETKKRYTV